MEATPFGNQFDQVCQSDSPLGGVYVLDFGVDTNELISIETARSRGFLDRKFAAALTLDGLVLPSFLFRLWGVILVAFKCGTSART